MVAPDESARRRETGTGGESLTRHADRRIQAPGGLHACLVQPGFRWRRVRKGVIAVLRGGKTMLGLMGGGFCAPVLGVRLLPGLQPGLQHTGLAARMECVAVIPSAPSFPFPRLSSGLQTCCRRSLKQIARSASSRGKAISATPSYGGSRNASSNGSNPAPVKSSLTTGSSPSLWNCPAPAIPPSSPSPSGCPDLKVYSNTAN